MAPRRALARPGGPRADLLHRLGLLQRALRWRAGLSLAVWACAVVVVAAAALGPVFALAAAESGLRDELVTSGSEAAVHLQEVDALITPPVGDLAPSTAIYRIRTAAPTGRSRFFPTGIRSLTLTSSAVAKGVAGGQQTSLAWQEGVCGRVVVLQGRCPAAAGEVMVSSRSVQADSFGWRLGRVLQVATDSSPFASSRSFRIVGVYRPVDSRAGSWSASGLLQSGFRGQQVVTDAVFTVLDGFARLPRESPVRATVDRPLDVDAVRLADVPALRAEVRRLQHRVLADGVAVSTGLPAALDAAADEERRVDAATTLVVLQLCVLGWLVLFQVLLDAVDARAADIALAKLRGFGQGALLRFGLGEPIALLVAALPVGIGLALLGAQLLTGAALRPGTPTAVPWTTALAVLGAFAGGLVAVAVSARRVLARPVLEQWRRTRTAPSGTRAALAVDLGLVAVGLGAFVALRILGPRGGATVLLGPGLLVLAAGLLGARLLPLALRPLVPSTAGTRRIALFLAVRQVVRRPAGLRLVALLTVAVGLATFGVAGESIAAANRTARANAELGASRVVRVAVTPGFDPVAATRRADPDGRWAAATARWLPFSGDLEGEVLAVDAARVGAVGAPAAGLPAPSTLGALLRGPELPPIRFTGTRLSATVVLSDLDGPAPALRFELRTRDGGEATAVAGPLRPGRHDYTAAVDCRAGCVLEGLSWVRSIEAFGTVGGSVLVSGVRVDGRPLDARLTSGEWRPQRSSSQSRDRAERSGAGLLDRFSSVSGDANGVVHPDVPDPLLAAIVPRAVRAPRTGGPLPLTASDGTVVTARIGRVDPVLPVVLDDGVLVDARGFQAALPSFAIDAEWSVWLSPAAPPDARARLRAAGLQLDGGEDRAADRIAELGREGPALALLLLAVTAVAGALLAVGGTTVSIGAAVRRRSYEAAALVAIGVDRGRLRRAALVEQLLLLGTAVVVGVPAGLATVLLALPVIPQSSHASPVPTVSLPPVAPVLLSTAALAALVLAAGVLAARRVVAGGGAARLREAEE